jgi:molybdopterin biosynthesis enzyme
VSYAGSDITRSEALLRAVTIIGSREIGMLAACGIAEVTVARSPRVAVISTGDELVQPGEPLGRPRSTTPMAPGAERVRTQYRPGVWQGSVVEAK